MGTDTDIDLDWVTFTDDDDEQACESVSDPCSSQATWRVTNQLPCSHNVILFCTKHKDVMVSHSLNTSYHGWACVFCDATTLIKEIHVEPIGK